MVREEHAVGSAAQRIQLPRAVLRPPERVAVAHDEHAAGDQRATALLRERHGASVEGAGRRRRGGRRRFIARRCAQFDHDDHARQRPGRESMKGHSA